MQVEKLHNNQLWCIYENEKKSIMEKNGGQANEVLLYHGSSQAELIAMQGFNISLTSVKALFGAGRRESLTKSSRISFVLSICYIYS